ncbi:tyrosine--tRNA ligase [Candidatus Haliotispira prima]|uniref:Tyrosine--tRNA ligase n=1 Tax=Candidatus Haliotispira prima TaxID=3034016 RepID=A0ABY8MH56_9SPIO|nr:tyrosine--tRNA ligase [Candidatus Haliotispira prima]
MSATELTDELQQRGLIQQCSNLPALTKRLERGSLPFYLGIDPTAPSLHCGHLLPVLLAKRLALSGHRPLMLVGSGTAKIGDPSGKTEMRKMLSKEDIDANAKAIQKQLEMVFADCPEDAQPVWLNNADWLDGLNYIEFLRDIGCHFSVNRMLSFESCKQRLERGLSFIEFNYQLLQSYDYLKLFQQYGCLLQIGGDDQWGNMVSGIDLIRRYSFLQDGEEGRLPNESEEVVEDLLPKALTVPLVTTSNGKKMGKTEQGAVFIDSKLTSPFDFFQYWRNCTDQDVKKFLLLFSFLPLAEIAELCRESGAALNKAKEVLAYEMCRTIHGQMAADQALATAKTSFGGSPAASISNMPGTELEAARLDAGIELVSLYVEAGLCASRNEARRLIQGGGAGLNGRKIENVEQQVTTADLEDGRLLLKAGKKRFFRFSVM